MSFTPEEFAAQPPELQRAMIELEKLRQADANLHGRGRPNWEAKRRLVIYAECCRRWPLIEVMETSPPYVLIPQARVSKKAIADADDPAKRAERKAWQGVGRARGSQGWVRLSTFEQMAGTNLTQWIWCHHRQWYIQETEAPNVVVGNAVWIPLDTVLTKRGRHVVSITGHT